jgi:hypothetical protein
VVGPAIRNFWSLFSVLVNPRADWLDLGGCIEANELNYHVKLFTPWLANLMISTSGQKIIQLQGLI